MGTHTTGNYVATLTAGNLIDLQNNSGEGASPTIDVDLTEAAEDTIANGDYILFLDGGATGSHKKEALADLVGIMAGDNLTASGITLNFAATDFKEHDDVEPVSLGGTGATSLTSNAVLTGNGTSAITAESNLTFDGTHLTIATGSIQVRTIDYSDGDLAITIADGGGITVSQAANFSDNIYLAATKGIYFDGGSNTYIREATGDHINFYTGGNNVMTLNDHLEITGNFTAAGNLTINGSTTTITDQLTLTDSSRCDLKFTNTGDEDHYIRKDGDYLRSVSYTHLTLPTILRV